MTGLVLIFVVVFVLVLAAVCALMALRTLSAAELPNRPAFPRRRTLHRHLGLLKR